MYVWWRARQTNSNATREKEHGILKRTVDAERIRMPTPNLFYWNFWVLKYCRVSRANSFTHISGAHFRFRWFFKSQVTGDQRTERSWPCAVCGVVCLLVCTATGPKSPKTFVFSAFSFCSGIRSVRLYCARVAFRDSTQVTAVRTIVVLLALVSIEWRMNEIQWISFTRIQICERDSQLIFPAFCRRIHLVIIFEW